MSPAALRMGLLTLGTLAWVPYLYLKHFAGTPVSVAPYLAVHIPCMCGALGIRIWTYWRGRQTR